MIKYEGNVSYSKSLKADFEAGILFGALKLKIYYDGSLDGSLDGGTYLFGFRLHTIKECADKVSKMMESSGESSSETSGESSGETSGETNCKTKCKTNNVPNKGNTSEAIGESNNEVNKQSDTEGLKIPNKNSKHSNLDSVNKSPEPKILSDIEILKRMFSTVGHVGIKMWKTLWDLIPLADDKLKSTLIDVFKKIMRQLMPRTLDGDFRYGLDDPYYTAKVLEIFAVAYSAMGENLRVAPVWDEKCFEGEVGFKGRIHFSIILINLLRLALNWRFIQIWREYHGK